MTYPFRNLVFEGGGVKGIAYVGALHVLTKKGVLDQVGRVGGTSAGAINALLLGLGYTQAEMQHVLWNLNFNNFLDDSWGAVRDTHRLLTEFGWYKGDFFHRWVGERIQHKGFSPDATFQDLKASGKCRDMYFVGTNLSTGFGEVFSAEHTPRMRVADAVRISMSIPLFFASVQSPRRDRYVDGGVLDNYPVKLFDRLKYVEDKKRHARRPKYYAAHNDGLRQAGKNVSEYVYNKETLGFRLDSEREIAVFRDGAEPQHRQIEDFFDYAKSLIATILESQAHAHLHSDDWHRTVYIDSLGVGTTQFDIDAATKQKLVDSGVAHAEKYFTWYDDTKKDLAINHVLSKM